LLELRPVALNHPPGKILINGLAPDDPVRQEIHRARSGWAAEVADPPV